MFLPRNDGGVGAAGGADERAAALEAANARIAELEGLTEARIRAEAEVLVQEIFPQAPVPEQEPRRYARPENEAQGAGEGEPLTVEERIDDLAARIADKEIDDVSRDLQARLDYLKGTKYQNARTFYVLGQIARAGDSPINIDKLMEINHNAETKILEDNYNARRAAESAATREAIPPPIPTNPGGVGMPGVTRSTTSTATANLIKGMMEKMGFGRQT
jgi:hypothetical protein